MNNQPIAQAPEPPHGGGWLDVYMPESQLEKFQPRPKMINFATIRGILFRQRWLIAAIMVLAVIAGVVVTLMATPMYQSTAKLKVAPYGAYIVAGQDVDQGVSSSQVFEYLSTQVEIIRSRKTAEAVANNLDLGKRYDLLGKDIDESRPPNLTDEQWLKDKTALAAAIIQGMVSAEEPRTSWVVPITVRSSDPVLAAQLANGYADAFVASGTQGSLESNEYARDFIAEQIEVVRTKLQDAETSSNSYARNNGIITGITTAGEDATPTTLTAENLSAINSRVAVARAARIEAEQRWRAIQNLPAAQLPEAQNNPALQTLITDRTTKRVQLAELRQRYNDDFPQIRSLIAQIDVLDNQIERTGNEIKASVRNNFVVAQTQENALAGELSSVTGDKLQEQDREVGFDVLEREAQALRDQLKALLDRYNQLSSAANIDSGAIVKLDPATVPGAPYSPNLITNLGLALVFGIALAGVAAVLRETMDDRIRTLDDIDDKLGVTLLGHTPHVDKGDLEASSTDRFSALMEAYSSIRASIDFSMPRNRNVIQFTSTQASEGKSTTAVIVAELFASVGRKTLLIDADLRRPSVASLLGIERPKIGLVEVLLGHVELSDAIVRGVHKNLDILPIGEIPPNPTEILSSEELRQFIAARREEYGLVIFDCCPVMGLADAPILSRLVDSTIFVLEANRVPFGQARTALRRLGAAGGHVSGVVVTKYRALEAGQSYDYQYGYYQYGK